MYSVHLDWEGSPHVQGHSGTSTASKLYSLSTEIVIHPNQSGRVIVNMPGLGGSREGYNNKYVTLARYMQVDGLGAVIRADLGLIRGFSWDTTLRKVLEYTHQAAQQICGIEDTSALEIYLMGVSTSPSAIAMVAADFPCIKRILLLNPAMEHDLPEIKTAVIEGMKRFTGEVYVVMGANDIVAERDGEEYYNAAIHASRRELVVIPNCNHHFMGTKNGRIFSQAPYWAFAQGETPQFPSPDPEAGIVLY